MIVLFSLLFYSIILRKSKSSRGLGWAGMGTHLLENVLPWHHTEEFTLRDLDSEGESLNEKVVLNLVSNYESDGALPIVLLINQEEWESKHLWLANCVSKAFTEKPEMFPANLKDKSWPCRVLGSWFK